MHHIFKLFMLESADIDLAFAVHDLLRQRLPPIAADCLNP